MTRSERSDVADGEAFPHEKGLSTRSWDVRPEHLTRDIAENVALECGWGRLIFGQTFATHDDLVTEVSREEPGRRDICLYVREPHVLVSRAPQELFIDPSHTYRRRLSLPHDDRNVAGIVVRGLADRSDATAINRLYAAAGMVTAPTDVILDNDRSATFIYLVAEDGETGDILGTVTGVDHREAFNDPEDGSSLWCLAVDPQATRPGIGSALVSELSSLLRDCGRAYLDLSVVHDNGPAIALYEKLGFERVPVYCVKRKNPINERLFSAAPVEGLNDLNPYAKIIAHEALRRGIAVAIVDAESGLLRLTHGGRTVHTRESLSELTTGVAVARCDDKRLTRRLLADAGLAVPDGRVADGSDDDMRFLEQAGDVVVKPARGEQGQGITVGVRDEAALTAAVELARHHCPDVLIERRHHGRDLRILVIDHEVVAAAVRKPATIVGSGRHTIAALIEATSRRRVAATDGESMIPLDSHTTDVVEEAGFSFDDVLPEGQELEVRGTANLHTGGTIHDVTEALDPTLAATAVKASQLLDIPVVGLDFIVRHHADAEHVIIEANERPGLANHEPQPTAERFVDLLFPATRALPRGWEPGSPGADHFADA